MLNPKNVSFILSVAPYILQQAPCRASMEDPANLGRRENSVKRARAKRAARHRAYSYLQIKGADAHHVSRLKRPNWVRRDQLTVAQHEEQRRRGDLFGMSLVGCSSYHYTRLCDTQHADPTSIPAGKNASTR